jgi:hypothetical protein
MEMREAEKIKGEERWAGCRRRVGKVISIDGS